MKKTSLREALYYLWHLRSKLSLDFPIPCILPFGKIYLAYGDGMGFFFFLRRPYEENEWRFVSKFLEQGMTFFDIGANQGFYTLLAAKQVGPQGKVFAFEPVPSQIEKLKKNIKINFFHNVITEKLAVGSKNGLVDMHVCLEGDEAMSSLREPAEDTNPAKEIIKVQVLTIDEYIAKSKIQSVDFVKIDVEGGELDVLKGAVSMLKNIRPILMCEVQDKRTRQWGYSAFEICRFLENYNYLWFEIKDEGFLQPYQAKEGSDIFQNLLGVPKEKINKVKSFIKTDESEERQE